MPGRARGHRKDRENRGARAPPVGPTPTAATLEPSASRRTPRGRLGDMFPRGPAGVGSWTVGIYR